MKSLTDMAGDLSTPTAQVLTALRIVATRAEVSELADWTTKELEGYEETDELPKYRIWSLSIVGSVYNPVQGFFSNVDISHLALPKEVKEGIENYKCRQGISEIEELLKDNKSTFQVAYPNLVPLINMSNDSPGWQCVQASAQLGDGHLISVVSKARQIALRLCLECEKNGVELKWNDGEASGKEQSKWREILKQNTVRDTIRDVAIGTIKSFMGL